MDKKDGHWSGIKHGEEVVRGGKHNGASSGDFCTLKPPYGVLAGLGRNIQDATTEISSIGYFR